MKISIFYHDSKHIKHIHLNTWIILCCLGALFWGTYTYLVQETPEDIQFLQSHYQRHQQKSEMVRYQRLKKSTESQLQLISEKLVYIESQLHRMEILSQSIAKKFNINQNIKANKTIQPNTKKFQANNPKELIRLLKEIDKTIETMEHDYKSLKILETVARTHDSSKKETLLGCRSKKAGCHHPTATEKILSQASAPCIRASTLLANQAHL